MTYLFTFLLIISTCQLSAQSTPHTEIVYAHKEGVALTMLMQVPGANSNGKAVINVISGNWYSSYATALEHKKLGAIYTAKGYRVFHVIHSSQPRFNVAEAVKDIKRAVQYVRYHAATLQIDSDHIGIMGLSSGGHLALMVATTSNDNGDTSETDPAARVSDRVQAVAAFVPPTDLLNFGAVGFSAINNIDLLKNYGVAAAFDFKTWSDTVQAWVYATPEQRMQLAKQSSPIYSITADDAPALLIHGEKDEVVPLQQSETMLAAYQKEKLPARLVVKKGEGHTWKNTLPEEEQIIAWFDKYLK